MRKLKIKFVLPLVAFLAIGIGCFTAFSNNAVSTNEGLLLANIEALAVDDDVNEGGGGIPVGTCYTSGGTVAGWGRSCDSNTSSTMIYKCGSDNQYISLGVTANCAL